MHCFSAHSPHTPQHQHWCKNLSPIKAHHIKPNLKHGTKPKHWYHFCPLHLRILWAEIRSRWVFVLQHGSQTKKSFFKIQPKFPQFAFLMEEWSGKSATVNVNIGAMEEPGVAGFPRSSPLYLLMLPQQAFADVYGEPLFPSTQCYIKTSCASPPAARRIRRTQSLGKVCPKDNSVTPSGQNLGYSTIARVDVFFGAPWATTTRCS